MKIKSFIVLFGALVAAACTNSNIEQMSQPDPYHKTISLPSDPGKLGAEVKAALLTDNWVFQDNAGAPVAHPRYTLKLTYTQDDVCMPRLDPRYDYELLIIDNQTGSRTFAMHGKDCTHTILDHLNNFLLGHKV